MSLVENSGARGHQKPREPSQARQWRDGWAQHVRHTSKHHRVPQTQRGPAGRGLQSVVTMNQGVLCVVTKDRCSTFTRVLHSSHVKLAITAKTETEEI